jgi:site-specific recombinase XerD
MKFSDLARDYVVWMGAYKKRSSRTCGNYELAYGQFRGFLQMQGLTDDVKHFNGDTCQEFAQYLAAGGNQPNSVNTKLAALGSLARYGMRVKDPRGKGYVLDGNPLERIERPQRQRVSRKYLYGDEYRRLMAAECSPTERVALELFQDTGCRVSELCQADVADLQDANGTIVLMAVVKGRGRQGEKVPIPLGEQTVQHLIELLSQREAGPKEPLLVNSKGERYIRTVLSSAVARIAQRAGITRFPVRAHTLRHTYNVVARVEADLDGPQRAELLNQTDAHSVTKYDHMLPNETVEARRAVRDGMRRYLGD